MTAASPEPLEDRGAGAGPSDGGRARLRLGVVEVERGGAGFAVGLATGWVSYDALGLRASTTPEAIGAWPTVLDRIAGLSDGELTRLLVSGLGERDMLCPIVAPSKILATGMNYDSHNTEMKHLAPQLTSTYVELAGDRPERPLLFSKHPSALVGPARAIEINTAVVSQCDYEVELAVVIGTEAKNLTHENAWDAVFGLTVANDVSARDWVLTESQFMRGKSFDTFCPMGPWIAVGLHSDVDGLRLESRVNGQLRQSADLTEMTFSVPDILVHASASTTLHPGDVVMTGTPPGVGFGMVPQAFLADGDVVECSVTGIGTLMNPVRTVNQRAGLVAVES